MIISNEFTNVIGAWHNIGEQNKGGADDVQTRNNQTELHDVLSNACLPGA